MGLKIFEATPTAISKFIREREQEQPKWCDEDCIIKDRNTEQAIKKAVDAERLRILGLIKMIRASPKPMADELSCLEKELSDSE